MKKVIALLLIAVFSLQMVVAADYEPYRSDEFPQWSIKLRRAETLFFGAIPLTLGATGIVYSVARSFGAGQLHTDSNKETLALLGIAGGVALIVALTDFIIGEVQK
ncbi:MAG: hypothetical protein ACOXZ2_00975 [Sphaerochaetaceae bacterium]|jgi:hypothetical protein|nr:hypothetical protein [Sphaerochaetaceae bacterium]HHU88344.1 hypothetical protein [Spirochaetales bacterium]